MTFNQHRLKAEREIREIKLMYEAAKATNRILVSLSDFARFLLSLLPPNPVSGGRVCLNYQKL